MNTENILNYHIIPGDEKITFPLYQKTYDISDDVIDTFCEKMNDKEKENFLELIHEIELIIQ